MTYIHVYTHTKKKKKKNGYAMLSKLGKKFYMSNITLKNIDKRVR